MATRPTLPYFAPAELLPGPLPTVAEILASKQRLSHDALNRVYLVGDHYAVKYGGRTSVQEGENMIFVQQSTSIPVPKVYAIFQDEVRGYKVTFIVMEYIPGVLLNRAWNGLGASEKQHLVAQLRRYMDELRSIPSPGYYGGLWRQQIRDRTFESLADGLPFPEPEITGPHETEEQFVEAMCHCLDRAVTSYENGPARRERHLAYLRRHYHAVFKGHPSVFTHADFFRGNIMVRPDGSVVVIDWERAGWYPSFWEYCGSILQLEHRDDWNEVVYQILDEYPAELGWFQYHRAVIRDEI
ncbi:hypothetical protein NEMBOFW57_009990 [Staphylotrichum longicolle]|uniref:Aminoglycoside phosphotransferase domain-containing protein n=1 Tax=Staphylotrichum longicolle TaxID=669026 RepID=A0AAD4HTP7_9PEZI|nr:hypothetical protein NEMBOFW57_009990 [Staphylotrichum longicolle]